MAFEPSVVIFDACILYPFHLRNIVVQIAVDRLVDARWTDEIHDEWIRNLVANRPAIPIERLQITRRLAQLYQLARSNGDFQGVSARKSESNQRRPIANRL
jgi:hypothetical protein